MPNDIDTSSLPNCVWGTPSDGGKFSPEVKQYGNSCVWSSEYQVMKDYGFTGSEEDVIRFATEQGWYNPESGTQAMHMGKALEAFGVPCKVYHGASVNDLLAEVMKGKKVLVTLDADELWAESVAGKALHGFLDILGLHGANHALAVVGFDNTDPQNPMIIVTDTGTGQAAKSYPVKHFVAAWEDGLCKIVVPENPPPHAVPFNLPTGISGAIMSVQEWVDSLKETSIGAANICAPDQESKFNASNIDVNNMNDKVTDTMNSNPMKEGYYLHGDVMANARLADLVEATSNDKFPVVYLDENELVKEGFWSHFAETFKDALGGQHGKYPMIVRDFNLDSGQPKEVILQDISSGEVKNFPLDRFLASWMDSNYRMLMPSESLTEFKSKILTQLGEIQLSAAVEDGSIWGKGWLDSMSAGDGSANGAVSPEFTPQEKAFLANRKLIEALHPCNPEAKTLSDAAFLKTYGISFKGGVSSETNVSDYENGGAASSAQPNTFFENHINDIGKHQAGVTEAGQGGGTSTGALDIGSGVVSNGNSLPGMTGVDMMGITQPGMTGVDMMGITQPGMTGVDMMGITQPGMTGVDMTGITQPGMTGVDMLGITQPGMTGVDMTGITQPGMTGVDMTGIAPNGVTDVNGISDFSTHGGLLM